MSIRSTLVPTLVVATAIATLPIQIGPAFAGGSAGEGFTPGTGDKCRPITPGMAVCSRDALHRRPPPSHQRNKMTGFLAERTTNNVA
jgi:hypothetical protein